VKRQDGTLRWVQHSKKVGRRQLQFQQQSMDELQKEWHSAGNQQGSGSKEVSIFVAD
jgi:hypothetical protein